MYALQLLGFLLFACQIIPNESSVITESSDSVSVEGDTSTVTRPSTLPEGYVTFADVHAAYKFHQEPSTWYQARDRCIAEGARLAIADSVVKIQRINSMKTEELKWVHVGIYKSEATNQWVRVDNDLTLTSIPWASDNPDGTGDCAGISIAEEGLVDYKCEWGGEDFVCEIPV